MCVKVYSSVNLYSTNMLQDLIGQRITELRKIRGVSQEQFSYEANMERSYLTHIEKGKKNISIETLQKIFNGLEISPREFFSHTMFETHEK